MTPRDVQRLPCTEEAPSNSIQRTTSYHWHWCSLRKVRRAHISGCMATSCRAFCHPPAPPWMRIGAAPGGARCGGAGFGGGDLACCIISAKASRWPAPAPELAPGGAACAPPPLPEAPRCCCCACSQPSTGAAARSGEDRSTAPAASSAPGCAGPPKLASSSGAVRSTRAHPGAAAGRAEPPPEGSAPLVSCCRNWLAPWLAADGRRAA